MRRYVAECGALEEHHPKDNTAGQLATARKYEATKTYDGTTRPQEAEYDRTTRPQNTILRRDNSSPGILDIRQVNSSPGLLNQTEGTTRPGET